MLFCEVHFAARRFGLAAALTLGLSAAAQQTIQFSKPVEADPVSQANTFLPDPVARHNPASFNAPAPLFGVRTPAVSFDDLPGSPQPVYSKANAAQWQKFLNDRKNWTLMTPEEILGIPTPEKILGVANPDDDPNLSAEERFLKREDRQQAMAATNGMQHMDSSLWGKDDANGVLFHSPDSDSPLAKTLDGVAPGAPRNLFFGPQPAGPGEVNEKSDSTWSSPFDSPPPPPPKPTPDQLQGMESFRALLDPPSQDKTPQSVFSIQPAAAPDPNMEPVPASFNPNGRSVMGLQSDIGRPTGIMPLPGVTGPLPAPKKAAPVVLPPPWMQNSLQNSTLPQRQF